MNELAAHGKLLLTGEYFVLNGAKALAIPLSKGQRMTVAAAPEDEGLSWKSLDENGCTWFEARFSLPSLDVIACSDFGVADKLKQLLHNAAQLRPGFFSSKMGCQVSTQLEFPRNWGLGSSSTLVWLVAHWVDVDPFDLQFKTFGGSGYDVACAGASSALVYQLVDGRPQWKEFAYCPSFASQMWFVYLGQKQDSRKEIEKFIQKGTPSRDEVEKITALTTDWINARDVNELQQIMAAHELLVAEFLGRKKVKDTLFADFPGEVKSLGAWGGDFVLAVSTEDFAFVKSYFRNKGFNVCLNWSELVQ